MLFHGPVGVPANSTTARLALSFPAYKAGKAGKVAGVTVDVPLAAPKQP